jgi:CheY-like chemotaxis protein
MGDSSSTLELLVNAAVGLAWPLLALMVMLYLLPSVRTVIRSRAFTVKIGDLELTAREASEQVAQRTSLLQSEVARIGALVAHLPSSTASALATDSPIERSPSDNSVHRILWVDDNPKNNAFEIDGLNRLGVEVVQVRSTDEALLTVRAGAFGLVITDMTREENGVRRHLAGLDLIRQIRAAGLTLPVVVYTTWGATRSFDKEVREAGGNAVTSSPIQLFASLSAHGVPVARVPAP